MSLRARARSFPRVQRCCCALVKQQQQQQTAAVVFASCNCKAEKIRGKYIRPRCVYLKRRLRNESVCWRVSQRMLPIHKQVDRYGCNPRAEYLRAWWKKRKCIFLLLTLYLRGSKVSTFSYLCNSMQFLLQSVTETFCVQKMTNLGVNPWKK